jgi:hypothetical protein
MRKVVLFTLVAVLAFAVGAYAQRPNFAGKWVLDPEKSVMGGGPGGGPPGGGAPGGGGGRAGGGMMGGGPLTITQTATEMVIERTMGENVTKTVYKLDGTESKNEGRGGTSSYISKWDGAKLVTAIKAETQMGTRESTEVRSLAADGTMVVETTRQGQNGPTTTKMVYNKQ